MTVPSTSPYGNLGQYNLIMSPAGDQLQLQIAKPQIRWIAYAIVAMSFVINFLTPRDSIANQAAFLAFIFSCVSAYLYFAPNSKLTLSKTNFTLGRYGREIPYDDITEVHIKTYTSINIVVIRTSDGNYNVASFFNKSDAEQLHSLINSCQRGEAGLA
ncbi:MAG: hypothetical protein ACKVQS_07895 [Fimbriimonadaceae bacterium]